MDTSVQEAKTNHWDTLPNVSLAFQGKGSLITLMNRISYHQ